MSDSTILTGLEAVYALAAIQIVLERGGLDPRDRAAYDKLKRKLASRMRLDPDVAARLALAQRQEGEAAKPGYFVHGLDSPSAQEMLAVRGLTGVTSRLPSPSSRSARACASALRSASPTMSSSARPAKVGVRTSPMPSPSR